MKNMGKKNAEDAEDASDNGFFVGSVGLLSPHILYFKSKISKILLFAAINLLIDNLSGPTIAEVPNIYTTFIALIQ